MEKNVKKAEAATRFGLRRNEDLSNKIYQMQKEMEALDHKYTIEVQMYKEALERSRTTDKPNRDSNTLSDENERLGMQLKEMELKLESISTLYDAEIKMYKEKLSEESNANVEEMRLKIQTLENFIEEMKLEYAKEDQRHLKQEYEQKLKGLERQISRNSEEFERELKNTNDEIGELKSKLAKSNLNLREYKSQCSELEGKMSEYEQDAKNYRGQIDGLKSGRKPSASEDEESEEKKRELQRRVSRYEREIERYKNKLAASKNQEKEMEALQEQVELMKKASDEVKADYEKQLSEYKHQVEDMKQATERAGSKLFLCTF